MDILFFSIVVFLFILAVFDLSVGVSNDAVNFLNSAIGAKAAKFRTIVIIAAVGIFLGAAMSNGMMDIARHGIFRPEYFSFYDLLSIFMAVMVTDILLLDVFNTLGMPTSTTVSMVFELLGASFIISLFKMMGDTSGLSMMDLLNTEKALSVILGIFLSVAIAFFFGALVQFIVRLIFSFEYKKHLKWKVGIFGGIAVTSMIYFILLKGAKDMIWMTPEVKAWIHSNTLLILGCCLLFFSALMQILYLLKVNVLKVVILIGTFALAMAFSGNDLVNFIGVPLSGFSSYLDYSSHGMGNPHGFMMNSLNGPAETPFYFLVGAGIVMVVSLATSKKAHNVSKTEIGLGSQSGGEEELFGSSKIACRLVRISLSIHSWLKRYLPQKMRIWINKRFDTNQLSVEQGASFDLIRGSVNLMLAGILIAVGTSMKLPLSTTFVTFMVAMGTSLSDRAWGRESAVFRITGVISVIGGWFVTAGIAFIGAAIVVSLMYWGGGPVMLLAALATIVIIVRSNFNIKSKKDEKLGDTMFQTIMTTDDSAQTWSLFKIYVSEQQSIFLKFVSTSYLKITEAFIQDDVKMLIRAERSLYKEKACLKNVRRKETLCLRRIPADTAIEKNAWFHLINNSCMSMNYNLCRITEVCREHVENNFLSLPSYYKDIFIPIRQQIIALLEETFTLNGEESLQDIAALRKRCDEIKDSISSECHHIYVHLHNGVPDQLKVTYVFLNLLQESQELVSGLRKLLRASSKFHSEIRS